MRRNGTVNRSHNGSQTAPRARPQLPTDDPYTWDFGVQFRIYTDSGGRIPLTVYHDQMYEVVSIELEIAMMTGQTLRTFTGVWE